MFCVVPNTTQLLYLLYALGKHRIYYVTANARVFFFVKRTQHNTIGHIVDRYHPKTGISLNLFLQ